MLFANWLLVLKVIGLNQTVGMLSPASAYLQPSGSRTKL